MTKKWFAIGMGAVLFPIAAFADLSGTATLSPGDTFSFDTGLVNGTSADFMWTGTTLVPQGKATGVDLTGQPSYSTYSGQAGYNALTLALLQAGVALGSSSPVGSIKVADIVGSKTNGANFGKLLVTGLSGNTIGFLYNAYSAAEAIGPPTITAVENNYSYIVPGLPNYGIAPGTLFVIKGSGLASATTVTTLQSSAAPGIPTTLNGANISVTVGAVTTHPAMYYATASQIAAVLPSNTPTGAGTITVSYGGANSTAANINVVASALGLGTYYGTGAGLAVATDVNYKTFNYDNSAMPGQTIVLWGSGLGADTADSDTTVTATPHTVNVPLTIYIGGLAAQIGYQGSAGYPGLNQINVTIPAAVPTGCAVSVVALSGTLASNTVTLPINAGGGVCSDPLTTGQNGIELLNLGSKSTYTVGTLGVAQTFTAQGESASATGSFVTMPGTAAASGYGQTSLGSCTVVSGAAGAAAVYSSTGIDAGNISVTGPAGSVALGESTAGSYSAPLTSGSAVKAGTYTLAGSGGAKVGVFSASVAYPANPLNWTNMAATTSVTRANGLTLTWSGGVANTSVSITGTSSSAAATASFTCVPPVGPGQFTIPAYVLQALPAGSGTLTVANATSPQPLSASGLDSGSISASTNFVVNLSYQ